MRYYKILFLLMIVALSSCRKDEIFDPIESDPQLPPPENVDDNLINGTIRDDSLNPLSDIVVQLYDESVLVEETHTTSQGEFFFIVEDIKDYLIYIATSDYQDIITTANPSDTNNEININLLSDVGSDINWDINSYEWISIEGKILNDDSSPSINTNLLLIDFSGEFLNYTRTDSAGYYKTTIPSDVFIYLVVDQSCGSGFSNDVIFSDTNVIYDDIIINKEIESSALSGIVYDCNNNPIESGQITFYDNSDFYGSAAGNNLLQSVVITEGVFAAEINNFCSTQLYYEAVDLSNNAVAYGEVNAIGDVITIEDIVICDFSNLGGIINVNINNINFVLDGHYAFEYGDYISIFSFDESDFIQFDFLSDMQPGDYSVEELVMLIQGRVYHSSGLQLQVSVTSYPDNNQENIKGQIEGEIYDAFSQQKQPFSLDFDMPIF